MFRLISNIVLLQYNPKAAINENQYNVWGHAVSKVIIATKKERKKNNK